MKLYSRFGTLLSVAALATFLGACSEETSPSSANGEQLSSSSVGEAPASSADSPVAGDLSSSSTLEVSSSSSGDTVLRVPEGGVFRWVGADDGSRIITGLDNGNGTSGYWYNYGDDADGGASRISWPVEPDWMSDEGDPYEPIVEACHGVCGTFSLNQGTYEYEPFVGVGFNVAGEDEDSRNLEPADVSAWGGLCVAYSSTNDILLSLGFGDAVNSEIGHANPFVTLAKSPEGTVKCVRWSQFGLGWGERIDMEKVVQNVVSVRFEIHGKNRTEGEFNVMSIGSYVEQ
ncbi:MAG: hypothetical protein MJY85_00455 [Fibrobacter sp.]|nr:hypothetical protein [Fibrobacter sp.]